MTDDLALWLSQLQSDDNQQKIIAASQLGKLGDAAAIPALTTALGDESVAVARTAALALGRIGGCEVLPALQIALAHAALPVRRGAVQALGMADCGDAVPLLVAALADEHLNSLAREALIALKVDPDFF